MQRAAVALLVGVILGISLPVGAHHSGDQRKLARRINRLEQRLDSVTSSHDQRILWLEDKTIWLDEDGDYFGRITNEQVTSHPETCGHADDAVWVDPEDDEAVSFLGCVRGTYP